MFFSAYYHQIKYILIISVIVVFEYSILLLVGNYEIHLVIDVMHFFVIGACVIWSYKNIDVFVALLLLLLAHTLSFIGFQVYGDSYYWMGLSYLLSIFTLWFCKNDNYKKVLSWLFLLTISGELFWLVRGYESAPQVSWYWCVISLFLLLRKALVLRSGITQKYNLFPASDTPLDYSLRVCCGLYIIAQSAMISEYLVRHCTSLSPVFIYEAYPYLIYTANAVLIAVTLIFTYTSERKRQLLA